MPGSRLELLEGVGHFPQLERAAPRSPRLLADFVAETEPAELDTTTIRERLLVGAVGVRRDVRFARGRREGLGRSAARWRSRD